METITSADISLSTWAKGKCTLYPKIMKHMRNSIDPLERVIAIRIMKVPGVGNERRGEI